MKKILKIVYSISFILFFSFLGISILININKNESLHNFLSNPKDSIIINNMSNQTKKIGLTPYHWWNKILQKRLYFKENIYVNDDGTLVSGSFKEGDTNFAISKIIELNNYAHEHNINFLYIVIPGKPLYDEELTNLNISCYRNKTANNFIKKLEKNNISYLDLRDTFRNSKKNPYDWFYKYDHHWTPDAGLEAAKLISYKLNNSFKMKLYSKNLNNNNYKRTVYPNKWIGENGKKLFGYGDKKDDFIIISPNFETNLIFEKKDSNVNKKGDFSILFNKEILENYSDFDKESLYYYYLYSNGSVTTIDNLDIKNGNILYVQDSFSNVVIPYLSLASSHITAWDMRGDNKLYSYLKSHHDIDTIIVAYTISSIPTYAMNDFQ